jgi:hypothetical protein
MNFISDFVLPAFVGSGSALLLVYFLGERFLAHRLTKDLEHYKIELSERTNALKTQLGIFAHEQNVAISRIDAQQAEAIHLIYGRIRDIINPISKITAGVPIVGGTHEQSIKFYFEHAEKAHIACGLLANTMADLAIYFDNDTYKKMTEFVQTAMNASAIYLQPLRKNIAEGVDTLELIEIAENGRSTLNNSFEKDITQKVKHLTRLFRNQLGIETSNQRV